MSDVCDVCGRGHFIYEDGRCFLHTSLSECRCCGKQFPSDDFDHDCTFSQVCGAVVASRPPDPDAKDPASRMGRCAAPAVTLNGMCRQHDRTGPLRAVRSDASRRRFRTDWLRIAAPIEVTELLRLQLWQAWTLTAAARACSAIGPPIADTWGPIEPDRHDWVLEQRGAGRTLEDIAAELGVTPERVRQIETRALGIGAVTKHGRRRAESQA